ncbi:class I SAM-dependent methyltransferase [Anaerolineales bacterium HSG24]|nr:class I SAM-dependent methyltransferase [Anaerolineales bacterium HSG24]
MKNTIKELPYDQLFEVIDKNSVSRMIDIACHKGEHIHDILQPNFPDAEIVGVEPKNVNFVECLKLKTEKLNFFQLDCRALNRDNVGVFDLVWSFGLIYHLDDPTQLIKPLQSITHERSYVCIEGHVASKNEQAHMPNPNPPIISKTLDGEIYHGKMFKEFDEEISDSEKDQLDKASLDNPWSFWLTKESAIVFVSASYH